MLNTNALKVEVNSRLNADLSDEKVKDAIADKSNTITKLTLLQVFILADNTFTKLISLSDNVESKESMKQILKGIKNLHKEHNAGVQLTQEQTNSLGLTLYIGLWYLKG